MNEQTEYYKDYFEIDNFLIVHVAFEFYDDLFNNLKKSILEKIKKNRMLGVILDVSNVKILDSFNIKGLIQLREMTHLMGVETVIVGIQPGVASAIADLKKMDYDKLITFINVNKAIEFLKNTHSKA